jgi:chromosomal replication initiator protein
LTVLAIDDIHRFPSDMYLQEELSNLVDELSANQGFLIVTATRPVQRLGNLWPALTSRLTSGLALRLDQPGPEARRSLVERSAALVDLPMPPETAAQIAASVQGTTHRIFSAVLELRHRREVQGDAADESIDQWIQNGNESPPELADILRVTAKYYSLPLKVVKSASRKKSVVQARAMAVFLARELCNLSYQAIADALGGRDHTTIMHSYRRIERDAARDSATQEALDDLRSLLGRN